MKTNAHYNNLKANYLFAEITRLVDEFKKKTGATDIISMGIGDVTRPLTKKVVEAGVNATREMGTFEGFHGYAPNKGYDFLVKAIVDYYRSFGVFVDSDEVFVSDGAKSDSGNIADLFGDDAVVLIPDPVYPVYLDSNIMAGHKQIFCECKKESGFLPVPDYNVDCDAIYLCSPNNPTGGAFDRESLAQWIKYAKAKNAVIIYDAAYEAYISGNKPRSIFAVEGARDCAIEICSLSKTAGFTGVRCGYTVIPKGLPYHAQWTRRQATKFNGTSYIVQKMAACALSDGYSEVKANIDYYMSNAHYMASIMEKFGIWFTGGKDSPYIWFDCRCDSWKFFNDLLSEAHVICTPGVGFGSCGANMARLTAFGSKENTVAAMDRVQEFFNKRI